MELCGSTKKLLKISDADGLWTKFSDRNDRFLRTSVPQSAETKE
jgi:hypothetical protein